MDRDEMKKEFSSRELQRIFYLYFLSLDGVIELKKKDYFRKQKAANFVGGDFRSDKPRKQASLFQRFLLRTGILSSDLKVRQVNIFRLFFFSNHIVVSLFWGPKYF